LDSSRTGTPSVYHSKYEVLVDCYQEQFGYGVKHWKTLTAMASRVSHVIQADDCTCPSSHTTYACLNDEEKNECLHRMQKKTRMGQQQIKRLQEALPDATGTDGVDLDEELHDDFTQLIKEHSDDVLPTHDPKTILELTTNCRFPKEQQINALAPFNHQVVSVLEASV